MTCTKSTLPSNKCMKTVVQENICHTYIHHKFIMQTNRHENLFFASYGLKDLTGRRWGEGVMPQVCKKSQIKDGHQTRQLIFHVSGTLPSQSAWIRHWRESHWAVASFLRLELIISDEVCSKLRVFPKKQRHVFTLQTLLNLQLKTTCIFYCC